MVRQDLGTLKISQKFSRTAVFYELFSNFKRNERNIFKCVHDHFWGQSSETKIFFGGLSYNFLFVDSWSRIYEVYLDKKSDQNNPYGLRYPSLNFGQKLGYNRNKLVSWSLTMRKRIYYLLNQNGQIKGYKSPQKYVLLKNDIRAMAGN